MQIRKKVKKYEVEKAIEIIKKYDNEEIFFNICSESNNTLEKLLADASQI